MAQPPKRFAIVGTGGRSVMFIDPIANAYRTSAQLVGLCDLNPQRLAYHQQRLAKELNYDTVPTYAAADFDHMIRQVRPDAVIVCTVDSLHHEYIIRALELGCDVITEKPMATDAAQCQAIHDAVQRTGRRVRVTFNVRWQPASAMVKQLIQDGAIGQVISVDMQYLLDTRHGADYFRRWHRQKDKSGGLLVHKSTHHFDLVNWWLDAVPDTVFAFGRLAFYGRENAQQRGIAVTCDRYTGQACADDPFAIDLQADERSRGLYLEAEQHDGYIRDRNVFGDGISADDTLSVLVRYRNQVTLNYSLNAFAPREGCHTAINGTLGRIEYHRHVETPGADRPMPLRQQPEVTWRTRIIVHPLFERAYEVDIPRAEGGHHGGDPRLQQQMFAADPPADTLGSHAGHGQGAASALIGIAGNQSIETGQPIDIGTLGHWLGDAVRLSQLP